MDLEKLTLPLEVADKAFNLGIAAAAAGVAALVGAMAAAVKATFAWADEMDSIQDIIGGTNESAAALNFTLHKSGVDTNTFTKAMVIMSKGLVKADGTLDTIGQSFRNWGIDVRDANGVLKTQTQLIDDAASKYATLGTQQEKVNFLTEVFGKSGAELIDFFDTLAQEGGLDAVTQKVKDFGLAIDPNRYEQFTRNLNELKLIATGLAVQFTEALMPALEGVMMWAQQFAGMSPDEILARMGEIAGGLPEKFEAWAESIDWAKASADLIAGIDNIDWAAIGASITENASILASGLGTIFGGIDWSGLFSSIGTAFMNFATGLAGGDFATFKAVWQSNWTAAAQIVATAMTIAQNSIFNFLRLLPAKIATAFALAIAKLKEAMEKMKEILLEIAEAIASATGAVGIGVDTTAGGQTKGKTIKKRAAGGYGAGTTLVGENGPELVNLPSGAYVNNNVSSSRMANQPVQAYIDYDELARTLARVFGQQMQRT